MEKASLVYDGDCALCTRWVESLPPTAREAIELVPAAQAVKRFPMLSAKQVAEAVQLVRADGSVASGARAVFDVLAAGGQGWLLRLYRSVPGFAPVSELAYRLVASHRSELARVDRFLFEPRNGRPPRLRRRRLRFASR